MKKKPKDCKDCGTCPTCGRGAAPTPMPPVIVIVQPAPPPPAFVPAPLGPTWIGMGPTPFYGTTTVDLGNGYRPLWGQ